MDLAIEQQDKNNHENKIRI